MLHAYTEGTKPLIPAEQLLNTYTKRLTLMGEIFEILFLEMPLVTQALFKHTKDDKGEIDYSPKLTKDETAWYIIQQLQEKAALQAEKKYEEFLKETYTEKGVRFMREFSEVTDNATYAAQTLTDGYMDFLIKSSYTEKEAKQVFEQFSNHASEQIVKRAPKNG